MFLYHKDSRENTFQVRLADICIKGPHMPSQSDYILLGAYQKTAESIEWVCKSTPVIV